MLLQKRVKKWMIVICLLGIGLLLPTSAYGQGPQEDNNQILRIIVDKVETNFGVEGDREFRLVVQFPTQDDPQRVEPIASPPCGGPQMVTRGVETDLSRPIFYDYDLSKINREQITIYYFAFEDNFVEGEVKYELPFIADECPPKDVQFYAVRIPWIYLLKEAAVLVFEQLKDKTYGYGTIDPGETDNWSTGGARKFDVNDPKDWEDVFNDVFSDSGFSLGRIISNLADFFSNVSKPEILRVGYCARLINRGEPGPTTCSEGETRPNGNNGQGGNNGSNGNIDTNGNNETCTGYTVQPGDTLFSIAARFNIWAHDLRIANFIPLNPYPPQVSVGQCLKFPLDPILFK